MDEQVVYVVMGHRSVEGERCLGVFGTVEEAFNFDPPTHYSGLVVWQWPIGAGREGAMPLRQ